MDKVVETYFTAAVSNLLLLSLLQIKEEKFKVQNIEVLLLECLGKYTGKTNISLKKCKKKEKSNRKYKPTAKTFSNPVLLPTPPLITLLSYCTPKSFS